MVDSLAITSESCPGYKRTYRLITHTLVKRTDEWWEAQGRNGYFWWDIIFEYGKWQLWSVGGKHYGEFNTFGHALGEIGYRDL